MNAAVERRLIRWLHLILSIPIIGYIYGPVAEIPQARMFTQIVASLHDREYGCIGGLMKAMGKRS
jgi:hypothetical protein